MVSQSLQVEAGSLSESLDLRVRVAELEIEIAQLRDALTRRQQIGVATGILAQRFAMTPDRAWSLLVRLSQNGHVKVRDIAQALIDAHCGRLDPAGLAILKVIETHLPDGVCLIAPAGDGQQASRDGRPIRLDTVAPIAE
jgi:ANTAR domain